MSAAAQIIEKLGSLNISYTLIKHNPVVSMEQCHTVWSGLCGTGPKNLFLCPRNKSRYFLVLLPANSLMKTGDISKKLNSSRLSFAPEEDANLLLKARQGALNPLGLMFDTENKATLAIESSLLATKKLLFHPSDNQMTVEIGTDDFLNVYLKSINHMPIIFSSEEPTCV